MRIKLNRAATVSELHSKLQLSLKLNEMTSELLTPVLARRIFGYLDQPRETLGDETWISDTVIGPALGEGVKRLDQVLLEFSEVSDA